MRRCAVQEATPAQSGLCPPGPTFPIFPVASARFVMIGCFLTKNLRCKASASLRYSSSICKGSGHSGDQPLETPQGGPGPAANRPGLLHW